MKRRMVRAGMILVVLTASGCASHHSPGVVSDPYGFFSGIWHGILFPLSCLTNFVSWTLGLIGISVFDSIQIVGRPNTGFWYYAGFFIGLGSWPSTTAQQRRG